MEIAQFLTEYERQTQELADAHVDLSQSLKAEVEARVRGVGAALQQGGSVAAAERAGDSASLIFSMEVLEAKGRIAGIEARLRYLDTLRAMGGVK